MGLIIAAGVCGSNCSVPSERPHNQVMSSSVNPGSCRSKAARLSGPCCVQIGLVTMSEYWTQAFHAPSLLRLFYHIRRHPTDLPQLRLSCCHADVQDQPDIWHHGASASLLSPCCGRARRSAFRFAQACARQILAIFHVVLILLLVSYYKTTFTDAGFLPNDYELVRT
jgi:hypothetical protein